MVFWIAVTVICDGSCMSCTSTTWVGLSGALGRVNTSCKDFMISTSNVERANSSLNTLVVSETGGVFTVGTSESVFRWLCGCGALSGSGTGNEFDANSWCRLTILSTSSSATELEYGNGPGWTCSHELSFGGYALSSCTCATCCMITPAWMLTMCCESGIHLCTNVMRIFTHEKICGTNPATSFHIRL